MKKIINKPISKKRISKRRYPQRICRKSDCKILFTPSDARQIYCDPQHRIDHNNDLRKFNNEPDNIFIKKIKMDVIRHFIDELRNFVSEFANKKRSTTPDSDIQKVCLT